MKGTQLTLPMLVLCILALMSMGCMYLSAQFIAGQMQVVLVSDFFGIATGLIGAFTAMLKQMDGASPLQIPTPQGSKATTTTTVEAKQTVETPASNAVAVEAEPSQESK